MASTKSKSIIINRASYKEDLSNARSAIKELSKYELRKYELERQKKILRTKDDQVSKKALKFFCNLSSEKLFFPMLKPILPSLSFLIST